MLIYQDNIKYTHMAYFYDTFTMVLCLWKHLNL